MASEPKVPVSSQHDGDAGEDYDESRTGDEQEEEIEELGPSKVVHVRSLPRGVLEPELVALAIPFGNILKTLIIQSKGQAFLEFETVDGATKLVDYYSKKESTLKGRRIFFQFSNRDEIKLRGGTPARSGYDESSGVKSEGQDRANKILLVSIYDCRVPITIENLHAVFSPYGEVEKIVTFLKNGVFKALIQFRYVESATNAKVALDGKNMYQGCCLFQILFSRLTDLKIKQNTPRSRDFTIPAEKFSSTHFPTPLAPAFLPPSDYRLRGYPQKQPIFSGYPPYVDSQPDYLGNPLLSGVKGSALLITNLVEQKVTPEVLFTLFGVYGDVQRVKIFYNKQHSALVQMADSYQASTAQLHLNHVDLFGKNINIIPSKHVSVSLPHPSLQKQSSNLARDFSGSSLHRFKYNRSKNFRHICPPGPVLHVSNLGEEVTVDELRGVFGSKVTAIQFFKTDRRMAFVRMASTADAVAALIRLHNHKLGGKSIKVSFSPKKPAQIEDDLKSEEASGQSGTQGTDSDSSSSKPKSRPQSSGTGVAASPKPRTSGGPSTSSSSPARSSPARSARSSTSGSSGSTQPSTPAASRGGQKAAVSASGGQAQPQARSAASSQSRVVAPGPTGQGRPRASPPSQYYSQGKQQASEPYSSPYQYDYNQSPRQNRDSKQQY